MCDFGQVVFFPIVYCFKSLRTTAFCIIWPFQKVGTLRRVGKCLGRVCGPRAWSSTETTVADPRLQRSRLEERLASRRCQVLLLVSTQAGTESHAFLPAFSFQPEEPVEVPHRNLFVRLLWWLWSWRCIQSVCACTL